MNTTDTVNDGLVLNTLKHRVCDVTRLLDTTGTRRYARTTLEAAQLMHAVSMLLHELAFHGLLPAEVQVQEAQQQRASLTDKKEDRL